MMVVLDTNIVASATFWRGKPAHCLEAWVIGKFDFAISHPILTEYEEVIVRLTARYPEKQPTELKFSRAKFEAAIAAARSRHAAKGKAR